jgi:hypothetical protein
VINDLWKYSGGEWTWMGGDSVASAKGVYGIKGTPSAANVPGARNTGAFAIDPSGAVWLFGGSGVDSAGTRGVLNDLWRYQNGQWTWINGPNLVNQPGSFGTKGVAASTNLPPVSGPAWFDLAGNFWTFGGIANVDGNLVFYNALWEYTAGNWIWMGGDNTTNQPGVYGSKGVGSSANIPSSREESLVWSDASNNLWLLGGVPYTFGNINDLWKYHP